MLVSFFKEECHIIPRRCLSENASASYYRFKIGGLFLQLNPAADTTVLHDTTRIN